MIGGGWFKGQEVCAEGCPLQGWPEFAHFASLLSILAERRHNKESKLDITTRALMVMTTV